MAKSGVPHIIICTIHSEPNLEYFLPHEILPSPQSGRQESPNQLVEAPLYLKANFFFELLFGWLSFTN